MTEIQEAGAARERDADEASEKMAPVDTYGGAATGEQTGPHARRERWAVWWLMRSSDRTALLIWFFWQVASYIYLILAAPGRTEDPILDRFNRYDSYNFMDIAQYGYDGRPDDPDAPRLVAFFPGLPLLLRVLHLVIPDMRLALVLISFVATAVVAVALSRLSESYREGSGHWTVLAFFLSPFAVFLMAELHGGAVPRAGHPRVAAGPAGPLGGRRRVRRLRGVDAHLRALPRLRPARDVPRLT